MLSAGHNEISCAQWSDKHYLNAPSSLLNIFQVHKDSRKLRMALAEVKANRKLVIKF